MNIKRIIKEEIDDLDWIRSIKPYDIYNPQVGMRFTIADVNTRIYTIEEIGVDSYRVSYYDRDGLYRLVLDWSKNNYEYFLNRGEIKLVMDKPINESDDLDWIRDIETYYPIKSVKDLKVNQKYYIDYRVGYDDERLNVPVIFKGCPDKFSNTYQFVGEDEKGELRNYLFYYRTYGGGGLEDMINKGQITYKESELK
jgi:hypothetical protein